MITNKNVDNGQPFDFGRASLDYAKYRDIYPAEFYDKVLELGLCTKDQYVLDLGTGTGVFNILIQKLRCHVYIRF